MRLVASVLPEGATVEPAAPLELSAADPQPARLINATVIEGRTLTARPVPGDPMPGFAAFLDGTQKSHVATYFGGVPIAIGTVAAVVRDRRDRRLHTWAHTVERRVYLSRAHVGPTVWDRLTAAGLDPRDTRDGEDANAPLEHPIALRESVVHRVQKDRERVEEALALRWCQLEDRPAFIDGGLSGAEPVAHSPSVVGVVKSHRTLYASGEALAAVLSLGAGERSTAFLVTSPKRASVASWYLRLRDPRGRDPMWGLVRVEVAAGHADITARADEVSRWILAETSPVSLPDGRWDKMVYGVHDCEEFLRAIT
jgi:hypothetical protein